MADNATIQSVLDYFGSNSSIYRKIVLGQATDAEISYAFSQIPQMKIDVSPSGTVLGYSYADPVYIVPSQTDDIISSIDSNGTGSSYGGVSANYPISIEHDSETGQAFINAGKNGLGDTIKAVADRVSLGLTGVNIGCKLGKAIDQTLYNLAPDWWDEHYPSINPDTWTSLVGENETGQKFFRTLFNIDDNGNVTGYVDERVLAQTYQMLRDLGLWNNGDTGIATNPDYPTVPNVEIATTHFNQSYNFVYQGFGSTPVYIVRPADNQAMFISKSPFGVYSGPPPARDPGVRNSQEISPDHYISGMYTAWGLYQPVISVYTGLTSIEVIDYVFDGTIATQSSIEGTSNIDGATQYPPTNITGNTLNDVLQQLKTQYPDLFTDSITENVVQPDGTVTPRTYVPIPWQTTNPTDKTQTSPVTQENPTTQTQINPDIAPDVITQSTTTSLDDNSTPPPPDTPDTGTGTTDPIVLPTGQASSLWAIYNPTQGELNSFGGWLWSSNFVEQLKKLFNDPMQAIIGVHKVFATPSTGESRTIVCGYLDSGVSSKIVTSQYTQVDCGSVSLPEYFGNVFDYSPFTTVKIYLPFIGIVPLDVSYIMRSTISVEYTVDVLTGACLANVNISRDGAGGVIYSYGGSAIVSYPISSGSYTGVVAGALSLATGIVGTIASGGAMLPATMGALSGLGKIKTEIQHSGQFSGSAGAMGNKKPYLIISRPQTRVANNINIFNGLPSNSYTKIGDCNGFIKVEKVHLVISKAFKNEIAEIEQYLTTGILLNDDNTQPPSPSGVHALTVTNNGSYYAEGNIIGYSPVIVAFPDGDNMYF